jgi:hypothetical protein
MLIKFCQKLKEFKMAKNTFFIGILCMALVFGLSVIGCENETNSNPVPVPTWSGAMAFLASRGIPAIPQPEGLSINPSYNQVSSTQGFEFGYTGADETFANTYIASVKSAINGTIGTPAQDDDGTSRRLCRWEIPQSDTSETLLIIIYSKDGTFESGGGTIPAGLLLIRGYDYSPGDH